MAVAQEKPVEQQALAKIEPQALIMAALDKGAAVETIEKLVTLAKEMDAFNAKKAYDYAVAEFQRDAPVIKKTRTANIRGSGANYSYTFAGLPDISKVILPKLGALGLSISYRFPDPKKNNAIAVICRLSHSMGHYEESGTLEITKPTSGGNNEAQREAIAISYAKRYSLTAMLGLSPEDEEDTDGSMEEKPVVGKTKLFNDKKEAVEAEVIHEEVKPTKDQVAAVQAFEKIGIMRETLERYMRKPAVEWDDANLADLKKLGVRLKKEGDQGVRKWIESFEKTETEMFPEPKKDAVTFGND